PLARTAKESRAVIQAAQEADRLLGVDLSYRFITAVRQVHQIIGQGELGEIFSVEMAFHNGYGPEKAWFYERELSGGGCVLDLGIHLVDLALWNLDFPKVLETTSRLFARGQPLARGGVDDYATARMDLAR